MVVGMEARRAGLGGLWDLACRAYCRTGGIVDRGEAISLPTWHCSTSTMAGDVPSTAVAGVLCPLRGTAMSCEYCALIAMRAIDLDCAGAFRAYARAYATCQSDCSFIGWMLRLKFVLTFLLFEQEPI